MALALVGASYFFRYWTKTRDSLFLKFGTAFLFMGVEKIVLLTTESPNVEDRYMIYLIRLASFGLIIYAIIVKNRSGERESF